MSNNVTFNINISGNAVNSVNKITQSFAKFTSIANNSTTVLNSFNAKVISMNQGIGVVKNFSEAFSGAMQSGLNLNTSLSDLSAIAGVAGGKLQEIGGYARATAKTFGGSAAQSVEAYKLVLSQLSPEIAKVPAALSVHTKVNIFSVPAAIINKPAEKTGI